MMPVGIRGRPCVIATSSIPDQAGSKIPFLAGQDWMLFMDTCLDIGRSLAVFREIGVQAPLHVDTTGHLVIAIDEMPNSGWPQDLVARKDGYPGVLFEQSGRNTNAAGRRKEAQCAFSPTHTYEPNDAVEGIPCTVAADHWEFLGRQAGVCAAPLPAQEDFVLPGRHSGRARPQGFAASAHHGESGVGRAFV